MELGQLLKDIRESHDLTPEDFAAFIGVTRSYLYLLEKDLRSPSIRLLEEIEYLYNLKFIVTYEKDVIHEKEL